MIIMFGQEFDSPHLHLAPANREFHKVFLFAGVFFVQLFWNPNLDQL